MADTDEMTAVPSSSLSCLSDLAFLHLNNNALTSLPILGPDGLQLTALTTLDVGENQITELDVATFAGLAHFNSLSMDSNLLTEIRPNTFSDLKKLKFLVGHQSSGV